MVSCLAGRSVVTVGTADRVLPSCKVVSRQLARDSGLGRGAQHETQVEPASAAWGSTIVAVFQNGRFADDGAATIGFATSHDGGRNWRSGVLPRLSMFQKPVGAHERVTDPVVAYDAAHRTWLAGSLGFRLESVDLLVSRSRDGLRWSPPVTAAASPVGSYDKEWLACDNWSGSPNRGRCYLTYVDFDASSVHVRRSNDGGRRWSAPAVRRPVLPQLTINGVQPVVLPDGTLVIAFSVFDRFGNPNHLAAVRSLDGGITLGPPTRVADLEVNDVQQVRSAPLPSAAVDAGGTIWMAWSDCRFDAECDSNGVVVSRSRDGISWTEPTPVPVGRPSSLVDHFLPALAVSGGGARPARLAIVYYSLPQAFGCGYACAGAVETWLSVSRGGRFDWTKPQRLTERPMRFSWIANSGVGRMLGDYIAISWSGGRPVPVFALASRPVHGSLRQAIFATTRLP
jgi:hypothetical protein